MTLTDKIRSLLNLPPSDTPPPEQPCYLTPEEVVAAYFANGDPRPPDTDRLPTTPFVSLTLTTYAPTPDPLTTYLAGYITVEVGQRGQLVVTDWTGREVWEAARTLAFSTAWTDPRAVPGVKWQSRVVDVPRSVTVYAPGEWKEYRVDQ